MSSPEVVQSQSTNHCLESCRNASLSKNGVDCLWTSSALSARLAISPRFRRTWTGPGTKTFERNIQTTHISSLTGWNKCKTFSVWTNPETHKTIPSTQRTMPDSQLTISDTKLTNPCTRSQEFNKYSKSCCCKTMFSSVRIL